MNTKIKKECPVSGCRTHYSLDIDHDRELSEIYGCGVVSVECEHRIVIERIADDDGALLDFIRDEHPNGVEYDGPMYSGEGLGNPREYLPYREAMRDAGRRF